MPKPSTVEKFIEEINASPELTRECTKALDGSKDAKKFVKLGAKHGFKFTQTEARSYFRNIAQAPSALALSEKKLKAVVGAKVDAELPSRGEQIKNVLTMLRGMNFKKPPTWTVFSFSPSPKRS